MAVRDLAPSPPLFVAVGGLSGTGKSTLGRGLAPLIGHPPGALHLRSDQIRKGLAGVGDAERLPEDSYTPEASRAVYETVRMAATAALSAGWSVIVDTVAARADERAAFADIAASVGARFVGLWLEAPADVLTARVTARTGDASDADARVVGLQLGYETGTIDWAAVDASGTAEETFERAREVFRTTPPCHGEV
jgi:predicted kinase